MVSTVKGSWVGRASDVGAVTGSSGGGTSRPATNITGANWIKNSVGYEFIVLNVGEPSRLCECQNGSMRKVFPCWVIDFPWEWPLLSGPLSPLAGGTVNFVFTVTQQLAISRGPLSPCTPQGPTSLLWRDHKVAPTNSLSHGTAAPDITTRSKWRPARRVFPNRFIFFPIVLEVPGVAYLPSNPGCDPFIVLSHSKLNAHLISYFDFPLTSAVVRGA